MKRIGAVIVLGGAFLGTGACSSDDAAKEIKRAKLAEGCTINSDCSQQPDPLVCAFQRCHIKCNTNADCEPGLRCMRGDKPEHVCQLPDEVPTPPCKYSSDCPGDQVCGIDGECRDSCKTNKDCVALQLCVSGTCASKEELDANGQLKPQPGIDGGPVECEYNSDCPGDQICRPQGTCGLECKGAKDCAATESCVGSKCVPTGGGPTTLPEHCKNSQKDGDESGVDCGGSCYPCPSGGDCGKKEDCASQVCTAGKCQEPTCSDGVRNGSETGTDCGGPSCTACPPAQTCSGPTDCSTGLCKSGVCVDATCADGQQNGQETDVDCGGGACPACDGAGKGCVIGGDCASGVCTAYSCALPTCTDGLKNGKETGQDCGGADCKPCTAGKGCSAPSDCVSNVCTSGSCVAAACTDTVKNGNETDVDCGGADCGKCASGKACAQATDCAAGSCVGNLCKGTFKLTITPAGTGAGTVKSDVGGIDCGATCSADILEGTSVVLTATAASSSAFSGWSGGGCTGTGTCSLTLSADTKVTATFGGTAPGGTVVSKVLGSSAASTPTPSVAFTDASGNIIAAGGYAGSADFGGGPLQSVETDGYVAKYTANMSYVWSRKLSGTGYQDVQRAVAEPGGDVIVAGITEGNVDLGGGSMSCGSGALFVARYAAASGQHVWSKCVGKVTNVRAMVLDGAGSFVLAGSLPAGTSDLGAGPLVAQGADMYVAVFSMASGATVSSKRFGGSADDFGQDLARTAGGWLLVGSCTGSVDFGGGKVTAGLGGADICVARLDAAFAPTWVRQVGGLLNDIGRAGAFALGGKPLVAAGFRDQVDFDTGIVDVSKGAEDIVLLRFNDGTGAIEWHKVFADTGNARVDDLAVDPTSGAVTLVGSFSSESPSFGGPTLSAGGTSVFAVKLDAAGGHLFTTANYGSGPGPITVDAVALNPSGGAVYATRSANGGWTATKVYVLAP